MPVKLTLCHTQVLGERCARSFSLVEKKRTEYILKFIPGICHLKAFQNELFSKVRDPFEI